MAAQLTWRPQLGSFSFHVGDVKAWDALPWPRITALSSYFNFCHICKNQILGEDWKSSMELYLPTSIGKQGLQYWEVCLRGISGSLTSLLLFKSEVTALYDGNIALRGAIEYARTAGLSHPSNIISRNINEECISRRTFH